jgi:cell division septal protein FtsQ
MPERLATALLAHPWVAEVQSVRLVYPNGAEVKLLYREPVAMVELNGGLLPVDKNGVLLRTDYFRSIAPEAASKFPRIIGTITPPLGTVGTSWGDGKIVAAAYLAGILQTLPPDSGIQTIVTENETLKLQTKSGKEITWGKVMPSKEPNADDITKREKLEQIIKLYNNLDNVPQAQLNDLLNSK